MTAVQMAHLGCPLAGDRKYGRIFADSPDTGSLIHKNNSTALKLCAYRLEFRHPANGKEMTFKIR